MADTTTESTTDTASSVLEKPIVLDETAQAGNALLTAQNALIEAQNTLLTERNALLTEANGYQKIIAAAQVVQASRIISDLTLAEFRMLVRNNTAEQMKELVPLGTRFVVPWKDAQLSATANMEFEVVHYGTCETETGETVKCAYLQSHYLSVRAIRFSNYCAFKYCSEELPAGTYKFTMGQSWGTSNVVAGDVISFTLESAVPAGGQLAGMQRAPDVDKTTWTITSHASPATADATETVTLTFNAAPESATDLGTINLGHTSGNDLWSVYTAAYGYGRWDVSAIRQYLNSAELVGKWWEPQHNYDRPPAELSKYDGFLAGFSSDFLDLIKPIKVRSYLNKLIDEDKEQDYVETYDRFFLPSLQQINVASYDSTVGDEGETWERYQEILGTTERVALYGTYEKLRKLDYSVHTTYSTWRLRSASRSGNSSTTAIVTQAGVVGSSYAAAASYCAPACAIY